MAITKISINSFASGTALGVDTGGIISFANTSIPSGFLLCDGSAVSRSTYSDLFSAISTTYGTGDGASTFNLPDLRGRVLAGKDDMGGSAANRLTSSGAVNGTGLGNSGGGESHTLTTAQLASHSHRYGHTNASASTGSGGNRDALPNALPYNTEATGGGQGHNNVQPTIIINYGIKT
mgnify:FL=1|jgi:microcystin-dependent protein|tara:strand:+ start:15 stop:548 length:534 start_codon:yes stop_codon:yes gene_type:complete